MKEAARQIWSGYRRFGQVIREQYLGLFITGYLAAAVGATINVTDWSLLNFLGVTAPPAMRIEAAVGWLTTTPRPTLVVVGRRTRYEDCGGAMMTRELIYEGDRPPVLASAPEASAPGSRTAKPTVLSAKESPDVAAFALLIPVDHAMGLRFIRWTLTASPAQCSDAWERSNQSVAVIDVPPYPIPFPPPGIE